MITITFPHKLNVSVQPTDILYAALTHSGQSGINNPFLNPPSNTAPVAIGIISSVNHSVNNPNTDDSIVYDPTGFDPFTLTNAHYLFFSKDRRANMSGIVGYFAETEYRNYSKLQTEIFATAVDYVDSSK